MKLMASKKSAWSDEARKALARSCLLVGAY